MIRLDTNRRKAQNTRGSRASVDAMNERAALDVENLLKVVLVLVVVWLILEIVGEVVGLFTSVIGLFSPLLAVLVVVLIALWFFEYL